LSGPSSTQALPAGPALTQTATVTQDGIPAPGKSVSISIASGGSVSGTTDSAGQFRFTYIPSDHSIQAQLSATCTYCTNTASKTIDVLGFAMCSRDAGSLVGNPIAPASGAKNQTETDWLDPGAHPLELTRTYRSNGDLPAAGLGRNWSHNYAATLAGNSVQRNVLMGNGSAALFARANTTDPWRSNNGKDSLTDVATGGWLYTQASDESRWLFDASGQLSSITQRNGWTLSLAYNASKQLTSVTNAFGRSITFNYNSAGQLTSANLPDGQITSYTFDSVLRLSSVGYSDKTSKTYAYEDSRWPQALSGIIDENGVRYASFTYDAAGRAISTQHAANTQSYSVNYGNTSASSAGSLVAGGTVNPSIYRTTSNVTDPLGNLQTYTWQGGDGNVRLLGSNGAYEGGQIASRSFGSGTTLPEIETDFLGIRTTYSWDLSRQLKLSTTQAAGRIEAITTSTQWHPSLRLPTLITEPGRSTAYTYDERGNTLTETTTDTSAGSSNGPSRTWTWTYTAANLIASQTNPLGQTWNFAYNDAGQRTSSTNPLGQQTSYTYDSAGRLSQTTEPSGLQTAYSYDPRGRLLQTSSNAQGITPETTSYSYTPSGQLASLILAGGYSAAYSYDQAQRLTDISDNRGNSIHYTLDAMGNRLREEIKDSRGTLAQVIARSISRLNRVAAISGASGQTTQYGFDANGQPISSTDPLNQSTRQTLDALRRPISTDFADNLYTTQSWNAQNQLTQVTDPKRITTRYQSNAWGEVTTETSPDIGTVSYQRDGAGQITQRTDAKGQTTSYTRDQIGRPSQITLADGKTQQFDYDRTGQVSQILDASGSTSYTRDALGRVLQKTQSVADHPDYPSSYSASYQYHPGGKVSQLTYPSGLKVFYRTNNTGQISQIDVQAPGISQASPFVSNLNYTALGQPQAWSWNNGDSASRSFDTDARLTRTEFGSYVYDAASRITSITQNLWASLSSTDPATGLTSTSTNTTPITWTASYDRRNRLTSFGRTSSSTSYTYDVNSNRLSSIDTRTSDTDLNGNFDQASPSQTTSQTTNQTLSIASDSNRLLGFYQTLSTTGQPRTTNTQVSYSLDANGNLTSDGQRSFIYDSANRLSEVQISQNAEAAKISYLHNALGQRVFKSEPQVAKTAPNETELGISFINWLKQFFNWLFNQAQSNATLGQSYLFDDATLGDNPSLLGEYGNGGNLSQGNAEYIWLPTESGQAQLIGLYKGGRFYAIHADHLGTPRLITDDANQVVWQWAYSAFGDNKPSGVLKATPNPKVALTNQPVLLKATVPQLAMNLRMAGQYFDEETGLFENGFRSYRPGMGSYTQSDPIGLAGGLNRYAYVGGNPLSRVDLFGLKAFNAAETNALLTTAYNEATAGVLRGLWNIFKNSTGKYDFGWHDPDQSDTFCVNGNVLNVDAMGNFIAGFGGQAYDQTYPNPPLGTSPLLPNGAALTAVIDAGILYHLTGLTKAKNDPFDLTGIADIMNGAEYAKNFKKPQSQSCGCK
jgi:RHS repeat-associated protein